MYMNESKGWHVPGWQATPVQLNEGLTNHWSGNALWRRCLNVPIVNGDDTPAGNSGVKNPAFAQEFLPRKLMCPTALRTFAGGGGSYQPLSGDELVTPNGFYGMNVQGVDSTPNSTRNPRIDPQCSQAYDPPKGDGFLGYKDSQVKHAAEKLEFVDAQTKLVNMDGSGDPTGSKTHPGTNAKLWKQDYDNVGESGTGGNVKLPNGGRGKVVRTTSWRHNGYANVVFFDGHAASVRSTEIKQNTKLWEVALY
jgi:prepilin-type processing-associated H-X9-DG protein